MITLLMLTFKVLIYSGLISLNFKSRGMESRSASDSSGIGCFAIEYLRVSISGYKSFLDVVDIVVGAVETFSFLAVVAAHGIIITVSLIYFIDKKFEDQLLRVIL